MLLFYDYVIFCVIKSKQQNYVSEVRVKRRDVEIQLR